FGNTTNLFFGNERMRGNIFKCTKTTNLKEYRFYLNPTASTEMWFLVYEGDTDTGFYSLVQISDLTPTTTGEGWYSSGDIQVRMTRNRYYMIAATFIATTEYFNQTSVAPFPAPASFGSLVGVAGWNWSPYTIFPPFGQQLVTTDAFNAPVAYYQTVITSGVVPWASASIESGTVRRGATTKIDLALDASAVRPGDYNANVRIHSNDPVTPDVVIPVHLHVNDGADIKFASGPVDFGESFVGASAADTVIVSNAGTLPLNVTSMSCSDAAFKIAPSSLFLNPGEITPVTVTFTPKAEGTRAATLTVKSNDPDEAVLTVPLAGIGRRPPRIAISSSLLVQKMKPDLTATRTFSISNPGESALSFAFDVLKKHAVAPPGRKILPGDEPPTRSARQGGVEHHGSPYSGHRAGSRREEMHRSAASFVGTGLHVLVLRTGEISEIVEFLNGYPDISVEADFDGEEGAPALADLLPYDAVLVINDFVWKDAKATGDVLADYVDHGGAVVVSLASFVGGYDLKGRFVSDGYAPFVTGGGPDGSAGLGEFDSSHPIMTDVGFVAGDLLGITTPAPGAQLIASWNTGLPCVATQKGGSVVGMNMLLIDGGYWVGDAPLMVRNALRWAAGVRWVRASPERGVVAPHQQVDVNLLFDSRELAVGTYDAVLRVKHNDPRSAAVEIPTELSVESTRDVTAAGDLPLHYALEANHPNPFNPATTIAYDLAGAGRSRLVVYDVKGARIRALVDMNQRAGHYSVTWDGRDDRGAPVASGVYFYRLTSGPFNETRKMVLLK
ncbi:MAG TPA: choice-of-anchor D domain-containing protein, partial [Candidatus Krumholzibacteria bacterium]|nr:choice-of-anchor D domain-containing protein [Candidatus Krumholzibacteria bacterium]